jgi:hypothetical protein
MRSGNPKPQISNGLGNARTSCGGGFHFAVKINFEGQGCSVKDGTAIRAVAHMALDFTRDLRCKSTLQIFAN